MVSPEVEWLGAKVEPLDILHSAGHWWRWPGCCRIHLLWSSASVLRSLPKPCESKPLVWKVRLRLHWEECRYSSSHGHGCKLWCSFYLLPEWEMRNNTIACWFNLTSKEATYPRICFDNVDNCWRFRKKHPLEPRTFGIVVLQRINGLDPSIQPRSLWFSSTIQTNLDVCRRSAIAECIPKQDCWEKAPHVHLDFFSTAKMVGNWLNMAKMSLF